MEIKVSHLTKKYGEFEALKDCNFTLSTDEILCVLGPSGSGKSTLLRCLCGLEKATSGTIEFDGIIKEEINCRTELVSVVFENPKLIDHISVYDNIALGLNQVIHDQVVIQQRVHKIAQEVEIEDMLTRLPTTLSLGQKQRVSLARALVRDCRLLLLDEALNGLDRHLKRITLGLILKLKDQYRFSCIYITHHQDEAKLIQNKTLILNHGKVEMLDDYNQCITQNENQFVKDFLLE